MDPFEFYSQVYGIDSFVVAPKEQVATGPTVSASAKSSLAAQRKPWIVFTASLTKSEYEAYSEMFGKITTALGLTAHEFALCLKDSVQPVPNEAKVCVAFGGPQVGWQESNGTKQLVVSSFQDMAHNPELKKSAWSLLKQAMDFRRIDEGRAF